ncbi:MAG: enolase C-terminal domain-like protein [archaeon]
MIIRSVKARIINNSRKKPAIEIIINKKFKASAPSGASTGTHEVQAFPSQGIKFVVKYINKSNLFKGIRINEFKDLKIFDNLLPILGGNPVIALQFAALKAVSNNKIYKFLNPKAKHLPIPLGNCVGGGAHSKESTLDIQEYLLIPQLKSFKENANLNDKIYEKLKKVLKTKKTTDESALIPKESDIEVFKIIKEVIKNHPMKLGIDMAASQFYKEPYYVYKNFNKKKKIMKLNREKQIKFVNELIKDYDLIYVEDPLHEEDFKGFKHIKNTLNCGDDLIATDLQRLKRAKKGINCVIIKPNQIGSLIKTKEIVDFAHNNNITTVISHRSGETMDTTIAHLAVAWNIPYIKCGIKGKERIAKIKELIKIEKQIK